MEHFLLTKNLSVKGIFEVEHIRDGKIIGKYKFRNMVTYEGMNHFLGVGFHAAPSVETAWFIGLINNTPSPTLLIGDEYVGGGGHSGWDESIDYDEGTRPAWNESAPVDGVIESSSVSTFTIDTTVTIYGILITSDNVRANEDGFLWATGAFDSPIDCVDNDTIKVNYSIELSE